MKRIRQHRRPAPKSKRERMARLLNPFRRATKRGGNKPCLSSRPRRPNVEPLEQRQLLSIGCDPSLDSDVLSQIELGALQVEQGPEPPGEIRGVKFHDLNGDGIRDANEPGLEGWTIFLDRDGNGVLDEGTATFDLVDGQTIPIRPRGDLEPIIVTSAMTVSGLVDGISDVDVTLNITHTYDEDLDVALISPSGTRVPLFAGVGGNGQNFENTTLDDSASTPIADGSAPFTGTFQPEGSLADFNGEDPNGTWILEVEDVFLTEDGGTLDSWSLTIAAREPSTTTDADGNYAFTDLTPDTYHVFERLRPGWQQTFPSGGHTVDVASGQVVVADFGNATTGIRGSKFHDLDGNGVHDDGEPGVEGWKIFLDLNGNGVLDGETATFDAVIPPGEEVPIIDEQTVTAQLDVGPLSGPIGDLDLSFDITHTWDSDLILSLVSPAGTHVPLFADVGDDGDDFTSTTLDDEAATSIGEGIAPFSGVFRPLGSLAAFDGENAEGTWTLEIEDQWGGDEGTLNGWSLAITVLTEPWTTTNAEGNYAFDGLEPDDYIVAEESRPGWTQTFPTDGPTHSVTLVAGQILDGIDFGNRGPLDFGDAPDGFPTLLVDDGARHLIRNGYHLGHTVDAETDGQPHPKVIGDDQDAPVNDEDGVEIDWAFVGQHSTAWVNASADGYLDAWIDFNDDGSWDGPGEHVFSAEPLTAGWQGLDFSVPADAVPGYVVGRFRFSSVDTGLPYYGLAPDGEVEDIRVFISLESYPKYEQPPQWTEATTLFSGGSELSLHEGPQIAADDWICSTADPVTGVTWWGTFEGWNDAKQAPPLPDSFHLAVWSDVPAELQPADILPPGTWSHPGEVLWEATAVNVNVTFAGWMADEMAMFPTYEPLYRFDYELPEPEWFYQEPLAEENVYWLSIGADYAAGTMAEHPFGWTTTWFGGGEMSGPDMAVKIFDPTGAHPGEQFLAGEPIFAGEDGYQYDPRDLAFQLHGLTGGGAAVKYEQSPDVANGMDVLNGPRARMPSANGWHEVFLADDFLCTATGPVTEITIWSSYLNDELTGDPGELPLFTLGIFSDVPADLSHTGYSMPGELLWDAYLVADSETLLTLEADELFFDPLEHRYPDAVGGIIGGDTQVWEYTFRIDPRNAFVQEEGTTYWLGVLHSIDQNGDGVFDSDELMNLEQTQWAYGWKTSDQPWNDSAVWQEVFTPTPANAAPVIPSNSQLWQELIDPRTGQGLDLSFRLATEAPPTDPVTKWSQPPDLYYEVINGWDEPSIYGGKQIVADDWVCDTNQPVTDVHWWGSFRGWDDYYLPPDEVLPDGFHIGIWTDVAADTDAPHSHPGKMIWETYTTEYQAFYDSPEVDPRDPRAIRRRRRSRRSTSRPTCPRRSGSFRIRASTSTG